MHRLNTRRVYVRNCVPTQFTHARQPIRIQLRITTTNVPNDNEDFPEENKGNREPFCSSKYTPKRSFSHVGRQELQ